MKQRSGRQAGRQAGSSTCSVLSKGWAIVFMGGRAVHSSGNDSARNDLSVSNTVSKNQKRRLKLKSSPIKCFQVFRREEENFRLELMKSVINAIDNEL